MRRTAWTGLGAVVAAGASIATVAALVSPGAAGATTTTPRPATVQVSSPSIPANSPLGRPLHLTDVKFGQQVTPSGGGGGAGQITNDPIVVDLPATSAQTQIGALLAGGPGTTVTVDLPDGPNGAYLQYTFSDAVLSSSAVSYAGGPNAKSTLTFTSSGFRVTQL